MLPHSKDEGEHLHGAVPLTIWLDGAEIPTLVVLDRTPRPAGWLRLVCAPTAEALLLVGRLQPVEEDDPEFGGWRDSSILARAVAWIFELDAAAKTQFLAGRTITKDVPVRTPEPLPALGPSATADDYRRLRVTAGGLVRPLMLRTPDESHLMAYQAAGVEWLLDHSSGILADDMGLGKTVQAIAAVRQLFRQGSARAGLVVCPRSLIANWEDELSKWAPELCRLRVTPTARERDTVWEAVLGRVHLLLSTYEQLRVPPESLQAIPLDIVIADEAHRVRNLSAAVTRGMRTLPWQRFWALTGTPIERDPKDLATLLSTLDPRRFSQADSRLSPSTLRARARPYILRRLKSEVLDQLPPVLDSKETLDLLPLQRRSYRRALKDISRSGEPGSFLRLINELRTICDFDPDTGSSAKVERISEIIDAISMAGEKVVVFSYLLRPLDILQAELDRVDLGSVRLEGSMPLADRDLALRRFRSEPEVVALIASTRVGGEGLTLTEANHVVFLNEWWNPSANAQARDRVVRIGQRRGVRVYRFRCRDTIEQVLDRILESKSEAFSLILDRLADPASERDPQVLSALGELRTGLESLELQSADGPLGAPP
jgi:SNF2 family DNA or RNA helicase